jgi:hypothetical protein
LQISPPAHCQLSLHATPAATDAAATVAHFPLTHAPLSQPSSVLHDCPSVSRTPHSPNSLQNQPLGQVALDWQLGGIADVAQTSPCPAAKAQRPLRQATDPRPTQLKPASSFGSQPVAPQ